MHDYRELTAFQNYFGVLSRLCQGGFLFFILFYPPPILKLSGDNTAVSRAAYCQLDGPGVDNDALFPPRQHITNGGKLIGLVTFMSRRLE